jgi:hypothetical protein
VLVEITFIPKEKAGEARNRVAVLAKAVEDGAIDTVDNEGTLLRALGAESIRVQEDVWKSFLTKLRRTEKDFTANYLLDAGQQSLILQFQWDAAERGIVRIVQKAQETGGLVLELPLLEDDDD